MWHRQTQWGASRLDQPTRAQVPPRCPQVPPLSPQTTTLSAPREFTNRGIIVLKLYCTFSIQKLMYTLCDYCQCNPVITCVCCPYKSVKMVLVIESLETAWPQIYYRMMNGWFMATTYDSSTIGWWQFDRSLMTNWESLDGAWLQNDVDDSLIGRWWKGRK